VKVIGVGDNVVDNYTHMKTLFPGGNALNFAVFAKKNGIDAAYLGSLAKDKSGDHLVKTLSGLGVDISKCPREEGETGSPNVKVLDGDRIFMGSNNGGVCRTAPLILNEERLKYIEDFDFVLSSCYSFMEDQLPLLAGSSKLLGFDFSTKTDSDYIKKIAPLLDLAIFSGSHFTLVECKEKINEFYSLGCHRVLATRGSESSLFLDSKVLYTGAVKDITPVDSLGAGDTYFTRLIVELLQGGWENLKKEQIMNALDKSADDSALTCKYFGAFGHELKY
jgi:fructoselysine 6-kinase